ncbi:hypothetical protein D3C71_2202750 [compost metagenome]
MAGSTLNRPPRVLRSLMPTPNSWLSEGPPTPRWVRSSTTDRLTGAEPLGVKVSSPREPRVKAP